MNGLLQNAFLYIIKRTIEGTCAVMLHMLKYVPGVQGVHDEVVDIGAYPLAYVPDGFKTQGICIKAVEEDPWRLLDVPNHFKTFEMCEKAVRRAPCTLDYVPDQYKTQEMCDDSMVVGICTQLVYYKTTNKIML